MREHYHWMTAPIPHNIRCWATQCVSYRRFTCLNYPTPMGNEWDGCPVIEVDLPDFWQLKPSARLIYLADLLEVSTYWNYVGPCLEEREASKLFQGWDIDDFGLPTYEHLMGKIYEAELDEELCVMECE